MLNVQKPKQSYPVFDLDTMKAWAAKKKEMLWIPCPICNNISTEPLLTFDRYLNDVTNVICTKCGMVYTNPRYTDAEYVDFYKNYYRGIYGPENAGQCFQTEYEVISNFKKLFEFKEGTTLLAVGCGAGGGMKALEESGCVTTGLEWNQMLIDYCRENGQNVLMGSIEHVEGKYNCILYNHVFEHILDLNKELMHIREKLDEGGLLIIRFPSIHGIHGLYHYEIESYFQDAHNLSFTLGTLNNLVLGAGFTILKGDSKDGYAVYQRTPTIEGHQISNQYYNIMAYLYGVTNSRLFLDGLAR